MTRVVVVEKLGAAENMRLVDKDPGKPGLGQVLLRQQALGINFADIHYRRGSAPPHAMAKLPIPFTPGLEAAAVVESVGSDVRDFAVGDRVGYATATLTYGGYAEARLFNTDRLYHLPDNVSSVDAAALMYRGITVHGLIRSCYPVKSGDVILVHAAAGGIGTVLCQWAAHLGAIVIGTVSSPAKANHAKAHGCTHVIVTNTADFVTEVMSITGGVGVAAVFDGVGAAYFTRSFNCVRKYGTIVSVGQATGILDPIDPVELQHRGLYLTKFSGSTYNEDQEEYQHRAREVLKTIGDGVFRLGEHCTYQLDSVVQAHIDIESRRTTGSAVIVL
jgi:NADPH2:quinone reductase